MRADRRRLLKAAGATLGALPLAPTIVREAFAQATSSRWPSIHDLSGGLDIYGRPMVDCLTYAVEEINASGGLLGRQIKLISYDAQSNIQLYTQFATEAATKEQVAVVHAGITSASREAIRPVLKRFNTLYFYNTQYEGGVCDRNCFCTGSTPAQNVDKLVPFDAQAVRQEGLHGRRRLQLRPHHLQVGQEVHQDNGGEVLADRLLPARGQRLRPRHHQDPGGQARLRHVGARRRQPHLVLSPVGGVRHEQDHPGRLDDVRQRARAAGDVRPRSTRGTSPPRATSRSSTRRRTRPS